MVETKNLIIERMVNLIDNLMSYANPKIAEWNERDREIFILMFLRNARFVEAPKEEHSDDAWEITDKTYQAIEHGYCSDQNYQMIALKCLSQLCLFDLRSFNVTKWYPFAISLATVFLSEEVPFFRWMDAAVKTMKLSSECLLLEDLTEEHKAAAIEFALIILVAVSMEQRHYETGSRTGRPLN